MSENSNLKWSNWTEFGRIGLLILISLFGHWFTDTPAFRFYRIQMDSNRGWRHGETTVPPTFIMCVVCGNAHACVCLHSFIASIYRFLLKKWEKQKHGKRLSETEFCHQIKRVLKTYGNHCWPLESDHAASECRFRYQRWRRVNKYCASSSRISLAYLLCVAFVFVYICVRYQIGSA